MNLYIDIETYSSVDIMSSGAYKYMESIDFEILMIAYSYEDQPIQIIDLAQGEKIPLTIMRDLVSPSIKKHAHNAVFERLAFNAIGIKTPPEQWHCSAIKAAYCGLPLSLEAISKALNLESEGKSATGKALIRYFSCPVKPTTLNGMTGRNLPKHNPEKWEEYKLYCIQDVAAEKAIIKRLSAYSIPATEREAYLLDQKINDRGILIDTTLAAMALEINDLNTITIEERLKQLTNLDNPNSAAQLKAWLSSAMNKEIKSLAKAIIPELLKEAEGPVKEVLELRQKGSKTSIKKYVAMLKCICDDLRAHGLFQFYGASRTGRWAGRLIQLQNLPRNYLKAIDEVRQLIRAGDYELLSILYDNVADLLSQLIRTAFIATENHTLAVADFSAIEARVLAWLAKESWRIDVFATHGKIYEASASMMFSVPLELIKKGNPEYELRQKGKVAELALGYGGAVGAMKNMGAVDMGLSENDMKIIVSKWRKANPAIVRFWADVEKCAIKAVVTKSKILSKFENLSFEYDGDYLILGLPSGRSLLYSTPKIQPNKWGGKSLTYMGLNQETKQWNRIDTYGGKLTENIVQAVARDLLLDSMIKADKAGFDIVMHVHDEVVCEVLKDESEKKLEELCNLMGEENSWAPGLPLGADGYITDYYKKD